MEYTIKQLTILHEVAKLSIANTPIRVLVVICQQLHLSWLQVKHLVTTDRQTTSKLYHTSGGKNNVIATYVLCAVIELKVN